MIELSWQLQDVLAFAAAAHDSVKNADGSIGHKRKFTGEPYILHPLAVAGLVASTPGATKEMIAAALLHDVVEDTPVSLDGIRASFGDEVAQLVDWLSCKTKPSDGDRQTRNRIDSERIARAPRAAQTIKLADVIANTMSIVALDPRFARIYLREKEALLEIMNKGDEVLHRRAQEQISNELAILDQFQDRPVGRRAPDGP